MKDVSFGVVKDWSKGTSFGMPIMETMQVLIVVSLTLVQNDAILGAMFLRASTFLYIHPNFIYCSNSTKYKLI